MDSTSWSFIFGLFVGIAVAGNTVALLWAGYNYGLKSVTAPLAVKETR